MLIIKPDKIKLNRKTNLITTSSDKKISSMSAGDVLQNQKKMSMTGATKKQP